MAHSGARQKHGASPTGGYLRLVDTDYATPALTGPDSPTAKPVRKRHFEDVIVALIAGVMAAWIVE
jgi:hypothetical protein